MRTLTFLVVIATLAGCWDHPELGTSGARHTLGGGTVETFVQPGSDGPDVVGLTFSADALQTPPDKLAEVILEFPSDVAPFNHVGVDWNPHGHPPPAWSVPHLDLHFYVVDTAFRAAIEDGAPSTLRPDLVPPGYGPMGATIGLMGQHWSSVPGVVAPLQVAVLYGSHEGTVVFVELMVSLDALQSADEQVLVVPQPLHYERPGHYPMQARVRTDPSTGARTVQLEKFVRVE